MCLTDKLINVSCYNCLIMLSYRSAHSEIKVTMITKLDSEDVWRFKQKHLAKQKADSSRKKYQK